MKHEPNGKPIRAAAPRRESRAGWWLRCLGLCVCALTWVLLCAALAPEPVGAKPAPRSDNQSVLFASGARMGLRALHAASVDSSRKGLTADASERPPAATMP